MHVNNTNAFKQENIPWKEWVQALLWHNVVYHKNEYSGYDMVAKTGPVRTHWNPFGVDPYIRGDNVGDIVSDTSFLSYSIGPVRKLTWKELTLALGFWKDHLLSDGHDCEKCPCKNNCNAYFKYDKDQECCKWWIDNMDVKPLEERYKEFMDELSVEKFQGVMGFGETAIEKLK